MSEIVLWLEGVDIKHNFLLKAFNFLDKKSGKIFELLRISKMIVLSLLLRYEEEY